MTQEGRDPGVVYVNGRFEPGDRASISVFDHGFLYGDGVFDTSFARYGRIFKLDEHLARLERSLRAVAVQKIARKVQKRERCVGHQHC